VLGAALALLVSLLPGGLARLLLPALAAMTVALLVARAALWREESRGGHYRVDFPERDDARWRVHSVVRRGAGVEGSETIDFTAAAVG